jgi:hypothetical protein
MLPLPAQHSTVNSTGSGFDINTNVVISVAVHRGLGPLDSGLKQQAIV